MIEKLFKKEKKLRLIKTDTLKGKTIRQLIFGICDLREKQLPRFRRIELKIRERQEESNRIGLKKIEKEFKGKEIELKKEKLEFEVIQRKKREKKFKEIRRRLEKNSSYFRELELGIKQRQKKLRGRSKCTFPVLCEYIKKYGKYIKKYGKLKSQ